MELFQKTFSCTCGKTHNAILDAYILEKGAVSHVSEFVKHYGGQKAFVLADADTFAAAGRQVLENLEQNGLPYSLYILPEKNPKPDETTVGSVFMHYDRQCDTVIAIGSGVINDVAKILASTANLPYIIVATAPSMDGYASATSSMEVDGLKTSLHSKCANVVIGDIDILKAAPQRMLISGIGDMLAKYISICEWRLGHLITGEYYCETIAGIVRQALQKCVDHASGLLNREDDAVAAVFEGLILTGVAMNYAGLSRPASGVEHYFSHVWDMRGLEFGAPTDFHGIQCAVGTMYALKVYEQLQKIVPNKEKVLSYVRQFDLNAHQESLKRFLGKGADAMIALEEKEGKYDPKKHAQRLDVILNHWDDVLKIVEEELIPSEKLEQLLDLLGAPKTAADLGIDESIVPATFFATKDIRDKYVLSSLCWDLGIIEEIHL